MARKKKSTVHFIENKLNK